jgi:hypothetical protein
MRTEKASVVDIATRREQRPSEPAEPPAYPVAAIAAVWPQIVERFRARSLGTAAHLAQAEPLALEGHVVVIGFSNDFARAKVAGDSVRPELERHLGELVGPGLRVRCVARPPDATDDPMLRAALETFQRPDRILDVE